MTTNPNPPGTGGNPFPCGGEGQQPCPPQPAIAKAMQRREILPYEAVYTFSEMHAYGKECYDKGRADQAQK